MYRYAFYNHFRPWPFRTSQPGSLWCSLNSITGCTGEYRLHIPNDDDYNDDKRIDFSVASSPKTSRKRNGYRGWRFPARFLFCAAAPSFATPTFPLSLEKIFGCATTFLYKSDSDHPTNLLHKTRAGHVSCVCEVRNTWKVLVVSTNFSRPRRRCGYIYLDYTVHCRPLLIRKKP